MKAYAQFHRPSALDPAQTTDLLGSDGVMVMDGRQGVERHADGARLRLQWFQEKLPHRKACGFTIYSGNRFGEGRVLFSEGDTPN